MEAIPIIVIGYNRPDSLSRLFKGLASATYGQSDIPLYISLDKSESVECVKVSEAFQWNHGAKSIIQRKNHLGLFGHVMECGMLASELGKAIILEDDVLVSPHFYAFAKNATEFYQADDRIAGISLYGYSFTESGFLPFSPLPLHCDTYFMQVSSSWGQVWTANQWNAFIDWFEQNPIMSNEEKVPDYILRWGENSWKKHFNRYLVHQGKYFVYPRVSYTTNFEDPGTHATTRGLFQVPLNQSMKDANLDDLSSSNNRFDAWFELEAEALQNLVPTLDGKSITVDTYGQKQRHNADTDYVLTSRPASEVELSWNGDMHPKIQAIVHGVEGSGLSLAKPDAVDWSQAPEPSYHFQTRSIIESFEEQKNIFHVLIDGADLDAGQLQRTLDSLEKQTHNHVQVTVFIDSNQQLPLLSTSLPISTFQCDEITKALQEKVQGCYTGLVIILGSGEYIKPKALESASDIFEQYLDIDWLHSVSLDEKGFIPIDKRWSLSAEEVLKSPNDSTFELSRSFFRGSWFQHESTQFVTSSNREYTVYSQRPPTIVTKVFLDRDTTLSFTPSRPRGVMALFIHNMCTLLSKVSSSTIPHKFYTVYFNLGDVIRFDSHHKTWYRERF